ncbi:MAG: monovalent cation/H(+) antiporter subunit G [Verrucomicrobiota bacterium]
MSAFLAILGYGIIAVGLLFMLLGSIGIIRLPDFFTRTHAASKVDTVGISIVLLGIAVHEGFTLESAKVLVAAAFIMMSNPVAAHALGRAALLSGLKPWTRSSPRPAPDPTPPTED